MLTGSQRNTIAILFLALMVSIFLFLFDRRESYRQKFDSVGIGMSIGDAATHLRDSDGALCGSALRQSSWDCWFRDDSRLYRVVFDRDTGVVTSKFSWKRKPRSLLDRLCNRIGFSLPY
jgi:hypothetical protein